MNPAILLLFIPLLFAGPKRPTQKWDNPNRKPPSNMSGSSKGYNENVFPSAFSIKVGFTLLGYDVGVLNDEIINPAIIKLFQKDYNAVSSYGLDGGKFKGIKIPKDMGHLIVDGNVGPDVLNALEHAITWLKAYALAGYWEDVATEARVKAYY